jgi:hypothetical protein
MKNKFFIFFLAISFYSLLFSLIYMAHIHFFRVNVIFYASLLDSLIALIFFLIIFLSSAMSKIYNYFELFAISCLLIFLGYSFSISVPTVIDRSLSFYYLEKIRQHDGAISKNSMRDIFTGDFVDEYKVVEMRLTEQLSSGTIIMQGDCIILTKRGYFVTSFSDFFRRNFLANKRLILDQYSDDLTDPLRASKPNSEYLCKEHNYE